MGTEAFPQTGQEEATSLEFAAAGREFLEAHGAGDLADREIEIVHNAGVYRGTIADAIGGRCPEFRTMAESMVEVAGGEILAPTIDAYVKKSELKKKS